MADTIRNNPDKGATLRGNPNEPAQGGTIRGPQPEQTNGGTIRGPQPEQKDGGTMRGQRPHAPKGGTLRGDKPVKETKEAVEIKVLKKDLQTGFENITLGEVTYKVDKVISASTGEAEIFKLSKGGNFYALKLYYAGINPDANVIDALSKAKGTGFIVDIIDHGFWQSPQGEKREYELQPFYGGGDLSAGSLKGNAHALKAVALSMLMGVKTAHEHNILHRDIKPNNFLYVDESRTQLVLCDFGIASLFDRDSLGKMIPLKTRAQFRTKIYAAPEIYTVIDGEIEYDDVRSDYYALGMTLLTLWMGEKAFADIDERALLRMKKGESGSLPIPDDMPKEMAHLISGLTVPNPDKRWGFEEFERWLNGEDVVVEGSPQSRAATASQINFLWSGSKNQVATDFVQLVKFMMDDKTLAKKYLYSGKISQWLSDSGYPELQAQVDEFVNKTYPKNQDAGVMATAYLLDGDLPYFAPTGKELTTQKEIAADMVDNANVYVDLMSNKDSSLYVYFRATGINLADEFVPIAKESDLVAVWRMIFTLDPSSPFPMLDVNDNCYCLNDTVEELLDFFAQQPEYCYDDCESGYPYLLYDEAFIMWLAHRDAALAGKIKSKIAQEDNSNGQLYYYVMYLLDPGRNWDCEKNQDKRFSVEEVAHMLNSEYMQYYCLGRKENDVDKYESCYECIQQLVNLSENRVYYYFKSKEISKELLDYVEYCFDIDSKDNKSKAGPYNCDIAVLKAIKALTGGNLFYYFPKCEKVVYNLDELKKVSASEQLDELRNGKLKWWLAVQYQEDPYADLSAKFSYEKLLADYTSHIISIDKDAEEGVRMQEAAGIVEDNAKRIKGMIGSNMMWRGIFFVIVILPLIGVLAVDLICGFAQFTTYTDLIIAGMIVVIFTILLRIVQIPDVVHEYLVNMFGEKIADVLYMRKTLTGFIYSVLSFGLLLLLERFGNSYGRIAMPILCATVGFWRYKVAIMDYPLMQNLYDDAINPSEESKVIEPLFYAWKDKGSNAEFDSETIDSQNTYYDGIKAIRHYTIVETFRSIIPVLIIVACGLLTSSLYPDYLKANNPEMWEKEFGPKPVAVKVDKPVRYYADVSSSLTIRKKPSKNAAKVGFVKKGEEFEVISFEGDYAKIKHGNVTGYVNKSYIKLVENAK